MKSLLSVPADYFPEYDALYVISDLHLGGLKGFQIFDSGAKLEKLIEHLCGVMPQQKVALLINGDLVDFLAEKPALPFDPVDAIKKLDRIVSDPAFEMVWRALQNFVATPNRSLVINLGNHDLELALPWVRSHLIKILSKNEESARGRIHLAFEGTGYICSVGNAQVLCVHGNEVDEWNIADYEKIRRLGRDIMQGRPVESWIPNAGTQMVIQIMNGLKSRFPFIDLLKPEAQAVLPTLLALAPEQQDKLSEIAATARRLLWDKLKMATGFLGREEKKFGELSMLDPDFFPGNSATSGYLTTDFSIRNDNEQYASFLLEATEKHLQADVDPISLIDNDLKGQSLGFSSALKKFIYGENRSEVLREALESLQKDRSFDLKFEDETFRRLDDQIGEDFSFIISGHTHLERALARRNKRGWYYNSGTWAKLIRLQEVKLRSKDKFQEIYNAFETGSMEALAPYIKPQLTVVVITKEDLITQGKLQHAELNDSGLILSDVQNSFSKQYN